jgi:uncharacterized protein (DUF924 family)
MSDRSKLLLRFDPECPLVDLTGKKSSIYVLNELKSMQILHNSDLFCSRSLSKHVGSKQKWMIARFGRYPHRNEALGRVSSAVELAFLQTPGSRF